MNKEQQTIAAIQKAVPDIMELKFGCKVIHQDCYYFVHNKQNENIIISEYHPTKCIDLRNCRNYKIIGRPITIQDILKTRTDLAIDGLGGMFVRNHCNKKGNLWEMEFVGHYEINKPFTEQSKETKDLIGDLILK